MTHTTRSTSTIRAASTHYSTRTINTQEQDTRTARSNAAHLCITIDGCGPASGRPRMTTPLLDLVKIVAGWPGC